MDTIFNKIDSYKHSFLGFNLVGAFGNIGMWRKYILFVSIGSLFSWLVLGWESTWNQLGTYIESLPRLLLGQVDFGSVHLAASTYYGVGQHLSTVVIYGVCFLLLSFHLERHGVGKSMNFFFSTALTFMSIGVYELVYNVLYSSLQNQAWTFSLAGRQGLNLSIFTLFVVLGAVCVVYLRSLHFKPCFSKVSVVFLTFSVATYLLWVFYPFPIESLTVQTVTGPWTSTGLFPQTMYAVNVVNDGAIGNAYFVENNLLHLVNVLNKLFMAFFVLSLIYVRRMEK